MVAALSTVWYCDAALRMQHRQAFRQILTFCDGETEYNIKFAVSERDELITEPLKHYLTFKMSSNAMNPNGRHLCLSPQSWE